MERKEEDNMATAVVSISNEQTWVKKNEMIGFDDMIKRCCQAVLDSEEFPYNVEVSVLLTDNATIHRLNREYRNVDRETDVLSFPLIDDIAENAETGLFVVNNKKCTLGLGDIVISMEKAFSQAQEYGHSLEREVAFLTVHSMLHLLGYDHETSEEDEKAMFAKQEAILNEIGIKR